MKITTLCWVIIAICFSCNTVDSNKNAPPVANDDLGSNIEKYVASKTNNPKFYKALQTSSKKLVSDTNLIKNLYSSEYETVVVDFDKPPSNRPRPIASAISEKYFSLTHDFEEQNNAGAIVKSTIIVFTDDSSKIVFSMRL